MGGGEGSNAWWDKGEEEALYWSINCCVRVLVMDKRGSWSVITRIQTFAIYGSLLTYPYRAATARCMCSRTGWSCMAWHLWLR